MSQEPKKRHSRARQGKRRASIRLALKTLTTCGNCKESIEFHTVCPSCGYYKGAKVIQINAKQK